MNIKAYLLGRLASLTAWIGCIGFVLEILLHMGHASTIMLILFVLLVVLPETTFRDLFAKWKAKIEELDQP